ncbi:MAG TPA: MerR family transcriptional regulator [Thermoleophilaceae bacterium]|nr:MerR family transcriptional regulator [Thermoleophilaceae bacterium]
MPGIRVNAAAELLGVSPNTLRSWERRFGFPRPTRSSGGHRQYDLTELEALRRALADTQNISSAVEVARLRGAGPSSPERLVEALEGFDERAADGVMEESLVVRSVERTVEEVMLPAVERLGGRDGREAEHDFGAGWAVAWLHAARRLTPPPTRREGLLLLVAHGTGTEEVHSEALDLALRRAGFRVLSLSAALDRDRIARAARSFRPAAVAVAGTGAPRDVAERAAHAARHAGAGEPLFQYRHALVGHGSARAARSLGTRPSEAVAQLRGFEGVVSEQPVAQPVRRGS